MNNDVSNEVKESTGLEGDFLVKTLRYIYFHRKIMGIIFILVFLSGTVFSFVCPSYYESITAFFFPLQSAGAGLLSGLGLDGILGQNNINEYAVSILKSRSISKKVIEKYGDKMFGSAFNNRSSMIKKLRELEKYVKIEFDQSIIKITVTTRDPQLSADVANYYLELYNDFAKSSSLTIAKRQRQYLQGQLEQFDKELRQDELRLLAFQQKEKVIEPKSELQAFLTYYENVKSTAILSEIKQEESKRQLQVMLEKLTEKTLSQKDDLSVTSYAESPGVQLVYNKLLEDEIALAKLLKTESQNHPEVKAIQDDIASLKEMLREKIGENLKEISSKTSPILLDLHVNVIAQEAKNKALNSVINKIEKEMEKIPDIAFSYRRLERDVQIKEKIYALLEMEIYRAKIEEAKSEPEIQLLDKAVPADFKSRPVIKLYLLGFFILSVFLSFIGAAVSDRLKFLKEAIRREEEKLEHSAGI